MAGQCSVAARGFLAVAILCFSISAGEARPARCFTSDESNFQCEFRATDRDGSFEISAPSKPTYILTLAEPGVAYGFVNLGTRNVPLPGRFLRSRSETGCWVNDSTATKICAW